MRRRTTEERWIARGAAMLTGLLTGLICAASLKVFTDAPTWASFAVLLIVGTTMQVPNWVREELEDR